MLLTGDPFYFSYRFDIGIGGEDGRELKVSTGYPSPNPWLTIPWNNPQVVPDDPAAETPDAGGWTFLYGPCVFSITAEIGLKNPTRQAQSHIRLVEADEDENLVGRNAWEWMVGTKEGNTVHLDGAWIGRIGAGRRLWLQCDYWHATGPALMNRANISGLYWRI